MIKIDPNKKYTVFHALWYRNQNEGMFVTDLQFDFDGCFLVFEWKSGHEGEYPAYRHKINPSILVETPMATHDFLIQSPVEIPENPVLTKLIQEAKFRKQI